MEPGATFHSDGGCTFRVWAPHCQSVAVAFADGERADVPLKRLDAVGWWEAHVIAVRAGSRYWYRLDGGAAWPDPASAHQAEGVHGPSVVVDHAAYRWGDSGWRGVALDDYVIYELHIGTFTDVGTCDAAITRLDHLVTLGVTAVEIMPVAQCPGTRNWGYDGVYPFAVQHSYGGPDAFRRLVDACHARGLAVVLDVVYNHLGPEGDYFPRFGPYFTDRHRIPWGQAINYDGPDSDGVRAMVLANAWHWFTRYHVDALRLDAVHAIIDTGARPILGALADAVHGLAALVGRPLYLIAESDLNDPRLVRSAAIGGQGLDSAWADDLHHALHAVLTGDRRGYYADYGTMADLRAAYADGFVFAGRWSPGRRRSHGASASDLPTSAFTVCCQNHDQIGNRALGERLATLTDHAGCTCAAAAVLLSPYLPLIFMGEEWAETRPFLFFVDHRDPDLREAVRAGRTAEFPELVGDGVMPDPFALATRDRCCLDWAAREREPGATVLAFYRACLELRRTVPSLRPGPRSSVRMHAGHCDAVVMERSVDEANHALLVIAPGQNAVSLTGLPPGPWRKRLDSADGRWGGPGATLPEFITDVDVPLIMPRRSAALFTRV